MDGVGARYSLQWRRGLLRGTVRSSLWRVKRILMVGEKRRDELCLYIALKSNHKRRLGHIDLHVVLRKVTGKVVDHSALEPNPY